MPAGRRRKTLPWQVRLQRWGALTVPVMAAAVVVPVASSVGRLDVTVSTASIAPTSLTLATRSAADRVSRDLERSDPSAASPTSAATDGPATTGPATTGQVAASNQAAGQDRAAEDPTPTAPPTVREIPAAPDLTPRWVTAALNLRVGPDEGSRLIVVLSAGDKILVTGTVTGDWAEVVQDDRIAWVHKAYLAADKPEPGSSAGVTGRPCPDGSGVESGLVSNTIAVYRAVCAAFPSVSSWGGRTGSGGNHSAGKALDIMVTGSTGYAIAAYVRTHAAELGVSEVIWSQRIWTVQRGSEGWRAMSDRGSTTANHYDHVHVSVY